MVLPTASYADDLSDCTQASDLPRVIVGCTNLLSAPSAPHDNSAIAYRNRSSAYAALGDFERAEQDYHRAIALNPQYVDLSHQDRLSTVEPYWLKSAPDP
jgi:tetratricopeptide (TPR) repeat protein